MKKVQIVACGKVEVKPFLFKDFTQDKASFVTIKSVTKKELKALAKSEGLLYSDQEIVKAKELLNLYLRGEK